MPRSIGRGHYRVGGAYRLAWDPLKADISLARTAAHRMDSVRQIGVLASSRGFLPHGLDLTRGVEALLEVLAHNCSSSGYTRGSHGCAPHAPDGTRAVQFALVSI